MGDHCDGDADCEALVDTFEADIGTLCDDLEDAEQGWKDAYEDVKEEACLTWCAIKNTQLEPESREDCDDRCISSEDDP